MTIRTAIITSALAFVCTAGAAVAQGPFNLRGLTRNTQSLASTIHTACVALPPCLPAGMPPHTSFAAGGAAFDGTDKNIWATSGQVLAKYSSLPGCPVVCAPMPCPKSSAVANASGLDVVESMNELWIVDDNNWLTRCVIGCPPVVTAQCMVNLLPGDRLSGVAVDDGNGVVFYTTMNSAGGNLYAAPLTNPCMPFNQVPLTSCAPAGMPAQGVAADWGAATVYWTDGVSTHSMNYALGVGPSIAYGPQTCCAWVQSPNDPMTDLTLQPRDTSPAGNPCANGTCPTCTNWHSLRNAPVLGDTIELGLDDAPEGSLAWCLLTIGSCTTGMPTLPPLCGPLLVGPGPTLGVNFTSGTAPGCNGTTTFLMPTPAAPVFAGLPLASQCVVLCGGGTGTALSNCQSWVLMGI